MVYDSQEEMDIVIGELEENSFIKQETDSLEKFKKSIQVINKDFRL
jgi:hypothetical protein